MFFSHRISSKRLAQLCHRLGLSLEAGIDIRTTLAHEVERAHGVLYENLSILSDGINRGESVAAALAETGDYFPTLMRELVAVGEATGHIDTVFQQLAEHYQEQTELQRKFRRSITGPMLQLIIAIVVIGALIGVMGFLQDVTGDKTLDILGFGLIGIPGLIVYASFLGIVALFLGLTIRAIKRGALWVRPIQYFITDLPWIGSSVQTLALSRLAWSMHLTMNAGMELRKALKLSLRSTQNALYVDQIPVIDAEITQGNSLHEAFSQAGAYPVDFLDALAVGEESGRIVETMDIVSRQYRDRASRAIAVLTTMAGWAVWAVISAIIIFMIFRVFSHYLKIISDIH
jgi:type II secretory pathway component PulF